MRKKVIIGALSLVGVITFAIVANYFYVNDKLTKDYSDINNNAAVVESREIIIDASPEIVQKTLSNVSNWSNWNKSVSKAELKEDFAPGSKFSWNTESGTIQSQIKVAQQNKIVWAGKTLGIFAIHSWTFEDVEGKTKVTSKESWEGLTAFTLQSMLRSELGDSLEVMLNDLKLASEQQKSE